MYHTCDSLKVKIDAFENDDKTKLEKELQDHLALAEQGYQSLRKDCERSKTSWSQAATTGLTISKLEVECTYSV